MDGPDKPKAVRLRRKVVMPRLVRGISLGGTYDEIPRTSPGDDVKQKRRTTTLVTFRHVPFCSVLLRFVIVGSFDPAFAADAAASAA